MWKRSTDLIDIVIHCVYTHGFFFSHTHKRTHTFTQSVLVFFFFPFSLMLYIVISEFGAFKIGASFFFLYLSAIWASVTVCNCFSAILKLLSRGKKMRVICAICSFWTWYSVFIHLVCAVFFCVLLFFVWSFLIINAMRRSLHLKPFLCVSLMRFEVILFFNRVIFFFSFMMANSA